MKRKQLIALGLACYLLSSAFFCYQAGTGGSGGREGGDTAGLSESDLGRLCVAGAYPTITRGAERIDPQPGGPIEIIETEPKAGESDPQPPAAVVDTQNTETPAPPSTNVQYDKPLVILYHTHATESYQPVSEGNFHTQNEAGSVREVGDVLTAELESLGIEVIHDKTLHDSPSYNQSYSRSLETVKSLLAQYPSAVFVVDLHRDAAAYTGGAGKTATVNGETAAKYSLVVGQGNPNVNALMLYAGAINSKAEELYPGFGGRIIEKAYKFNQYVSDYHILLEVGNNENNIREAKVTAKYFAHVLAAVIEEVGQ